MDGRIDEWTDGGRTGELTDADDWMTGGLRTDGRSDERTGRGLDGRTATTLRRTNGRKDGRTDLQTVRNRGIERVDMRTDRRTWQRDEWMDGRMDSGRTTGQMDGRTYRGRHGLTVG